jgi:hypothetical protein
MQHLTEIGRDSIATYFIDKSINVIVNRNCIPSYPVVLDCIHYRVFYWFIEIENLLTTMLLLKQH